MEIVNQNPTPTQKLVQWWQRSQKDTSISDADWDGLWLLFNQLGAELDKLQPAKEHYEKWLANSSLENWFPLTAEELQLLRAELQTERELRQIAERDYSDLVAWLSGNRKFPVGAHVKLQAEMFLKSQGDLRRQLELTVKGEYCTCSDPVNDGDCASCKIAKYDDLRRQVDEVKELCKANPMQLIDQARQLRDDKARLDKLEAIFNSACDGEVNWLHFSQFHELFLKRKVKGDVNLRQAIDDCQPAPTAPSSPGC